MPRALPPSALPHQTPAARGSRTWLIAVVAAIIGCLSTAAPSLASPITYSFTGTVNQDFTGNPLGGTFADGQAASGFITFDPGVADADANPDGGFYPDAILAFVINIGGYTASAIGGGVQTVNDQGGTDYLYFDSAVGEGIYQGTAALTGAPVAGLSLGILSLNFFDESATALGSDAFPGALILGNWSQALGVLGFQSIPGGDEFIVGFNIESMEEVAPIPEPATMALLGSGLFALAGARRRQRLLQQRDRPR